MPVQHTDDRPPRPGVDKFAANAVLPRHRHHHGYASVVLAGSFTEASFCGLMPVKPGDVLLHGRFDCHCDYGQGGAYTIQIFADLAHLSRSVRALTGASPSAWRASITEPRQRTRLP